MAPGAVLFSSLVTILFLKHPTSGDSHLVREPMTSVAVKTVFKQRPPIATTSDYFSLIQNSNLFVDKSLLIDTLLKDPGKKILALLAPEKWGKSVNLRMIEQFTEIPTDPSGNSIDLKNTLFYRLLHHNEVILSNGEKEILAEPLLLTEKLDDVGPKHFGKHPTIFVGLSSMLNGTDYSGLVGCLVHEIGQVFRKHSYLKVILQNQLRNESLSVHEQTELNSTIKEFVNFEQFRPETSDLIKSLAFLSKLLHNHFKSRVVILVDDYDVLLDILLRENFTQTDKQAVQNMLNLFFLHSLKLNDFLEKGILTGRHDITKLLKLDNIITVYRTILEQTFDFYGFCYLDMVEIFEVSQTPNEKSRKHYNWCDWSSFFTPNTSTKYSCQHLVNFVNNGTLDYIPRQADTLLENSIRNRQIRNTFIRLILKEYGDTMHLRHLNIDNAEIDHLNRAFNNNITDYNETLSVLYAYLFSAGYLTPTGRGEPRPTTTMIRISNDLVKMKLANMVVSFYVDRYRIPKNLLAELIDLFHECIKTNGNFSKHVQPKLQQIVDYLPLLDEKAKTKDSDAPADTWEANQLVRVILNTMALNLSFHYDYEITTPSADNQTYIIVGKTNTITMIDFKINMPVTDLLSVMLKRVLDTYKYVKKDLFTVVAVTLGNDGKIHISSAKAEQKIEKYVKPESPENTRNNE